MKKRFLQVCIVMALLCASLETKGLTLNPFKRSGRVKASSLIVVGNYMEPRLLAEIAQYYSKQPVLVISPDIDGRSHQLFFMPTPAKATTDNADQFIEIVKHVNPKASDDFHFFQSGQAKVQQGACQVRPAGGWGRWRGTPSPNPGQP